MAIGVFKLSKSGRYLLSIVFLVLCMIQVFTGILMMTISVYVYFAVAPILYSERAEISFVFVVIGFCGFNNMCCFLFALKIRTKCLRQSHKKSTRNLIFAWTCICFYIIIYLAFLAKLSRKVYKHVVRAMLHSFHIGISKYLKDENWKVTIDKIQYEMQCCGPHNHTDWHEITWLDKYQVDINSESAKKYQINGNFLFPITPWSCCKIDFPMECFHDPLQQPFQHQSPLAEESINTEGCIDKLKVPIRWTVTLFILLVALNWILQLVIFVIVRLLYTSCRNATILDDTEGVAPGWIFGRGDCGYNRGKTLGEIMYSGEERRNNHSRKEEQEKLLVNEPT